MIVHGTQSARVLHDCPTLAQTHAHNGSLSHMYGCPSATSCLVSTSRLSSSRSLVSYVSSSCLLSLVPRPCVTHPLIPRSPVSRSRHLSSSRLPLALSGPRPPGRPQPAHMRHEQRASVDALGGQSARQVKIDMVVERCRRSKARQRTFCCSEAVRTVIFTQRRRPRGYATNRHSATDISGEVWAERTSGPSRWSLVHHGWTPSRR